MTSDTALPVELASKIVDELFDDLRDRRFLKWLFRSEEGVIGDFPSLRSLDLAVQQEIRDEWATIIIRALSPTRTATTMTELLERLSKRAKEDRKCEENNTIVANCFSEQMRLFEAREGHNVYAVRMAVDHRQSAKRDAAYAEDLEPQLRSFPRPRSPRRANEWRS